MTLERDMTPRPQRYLFDEVFAVGIEEAPREPTVTVAQMTAAVDDARREAYERGLQEGRQAASQQTASRLAECTAQLLKCMKSLTDAAAAEQQRAEAEAAALGITAARKLAATLIAREPMAELEALLRGCLGELRDAPHLVVRVNEGLADAMRQLIEATARETGFTGRLVVLGEPEIAVGDGRIDWADGGIVRDSAAIERAIDSAIARHFGGPAEESKDENHG